jgi:hypothetical protein
MRIKFLTILTLFSVVLFSFRADNPIRIVFFGDSITQAGVGATGYITKMSQIVAKEGLSGKYELIGAGI